MKIEEEQKRFGIHKKTGMDIKKGARPTHGRLIYMHGSEERVVLQDQPFGFLQYMKRKMIDEQGYAPNTLKIKY